MNRIYKYPIPINDEIVIVMPKGAKVLTVQIQKSQPFIWALVDTEKEPEERRFYLYGTGMTVTHCESYIGSFQMLGGGLIYHLFEMNMPF
jgi:hypothetical protein